MGRLTSTERHGLLLTGILMLLAALLTALCSRRAAPAAPQPARVDTVFVTLPEPEAPAPESKKPKKTKKKREKAAKQRKAPPERNMLDETISQ